jgi:hypothetical protein
MNIKKLSKDVQRSEFIRSKFIRRKEELVKVTREILMTRKKIVEIAFLEFQKLIRREAMNDLW